MNRRTTSRSVTFHRPFILTGFDALQPAGTYVVDVDEEEIDAVSFLAFRRVSTQIQLSPRPGVTEYRSIDPVELDEALLRDAAQKDRYVPPCPKRPAGRVLKSRHAATRMQVPK